VSAISSDEIALRLTSGDLSQRLVVSPILDRPRQLKPGQAGIDVRLGRAFALVRPWLQGVAGQLSGRKYEDADPPLEDLVLAYGQPLIIHPHQFVLARTLEYVRLPTDLTAQVIGRSSWGRRGLIVATATIVHPGFTGPVTLEMKNVGEVPLAVYPLDRIAQLVFFKVTGASSAEMSQFAAHFAPSLGECRDEETAKRLQLLVSGNELEDAQGSEGAAPNGDEHGSEGA
jgi:dCTP deaminase